ncbi:hypothetical protein ACFO4O_13360 [Glaciecola siphonariae]|uniref:DUF2846 domain-containing protein n=1 Tax=Glaciecola siphonariae TaxID=521012 RepID=A0ABV9LX90_9ALTE
MRYPNSIHSCQRFSPKQLVSHFSILSFSLFLFAVSFGLGAQSTSSLQPLAKNEGYVVIPIIIEGYVPFDVKLEETKAFGESHKVRDLESGLNFSLIKLPAGEYQWSRINFRSNHYFNLEEHDFELHVKPDVINYGGHFAIDINYRFATARYNYVNRSSSVIEKLNEHYPEIFEQYPLIFSGISPDPFIAFYNKLMRQEDGQ